MQIHLSGPTHIATQCPGRGSVDEDPKANPTVILWGKLELSLTTTLGITLWSVVCL